MNNPKPSEPKHPPVEGVEPETVRAILRASKDQQTVRLADAIRVLDCTALEADKVLRTMAFAGYLAPAQELSTEFDWQITSIGLRLKAERRLRRIDQARVERIVSEVIARAQVLNADPDRLHRIRLKQFGSTLEKRDDYGDLDIAIEFSRRDLPHQEEERIEGLLRDRQPESERRSFFGRLLGPERQDKREILKVLKKGYAHIALSADDPAELGTSFKVLIDHDMEHDRPVEPSDMVVRVNSPSKLGQDKVSELSRVTCMPAQQKRLSPSSKVPIGKLSIALEDAPRLEGTHWSPQILEHGDLVPRHRHTCPEERFAGFQHLCPVWKEPLGGVAMLNKALDWCDANKVWIRDLPPFVTLERHHRLMGARLGIPWESIYFRAGPNPSGSLLPMNRKRISMIDLAGAYAIGRALCRIYDEARCEKMPAFHAGIILPSIGSDRLPDFRGLLDLDAEALAAIPWLIEFKLHE